jgi:hypothetical protein
MATEAGAEGGRVMDKAGGMNSANVEAAFRGAGAVCGRVGRVCGFAEAVYSLAGFMLLASA